MIVYLLGFMGSGKSTIGKKLSNLLGAGFVDLDMAIENIEGKSVSKIFSDKGEDYFRRVESEVLRTIKGNTNMVVSCGGGTPCFNDNMAFMNETGRTVYIEMTAAALMSRLKKSREKRPLIANLDDRELALYISTTLRKREHWYRMAEHIVGGLNPDIIQLSSLLQAQDPYTP